MVDMILFYSFLL